MRASTTLWGSLCAVACSAAVAVASPRPMKIDLPTLQPRAQQLAVPAEPSSRLIYIRRCPDTGCILQPGSEDDSRQDISSLAMGTVTIGPFTRGDAVWNAMMDCVRATYAPFNIGVTDVDPGNVPHYEHIVGGHNNDLRNDIPGAGGVSPFTCNDIPNAITFTFDVWGNNANQICAVVAQETAHAFGLEHELNNADPMTYLNGPLPKRFQAADASCGEYDARPCDCSSGMQNSYEYLLAMLGPGAPTPPSVSITSPSANKKVQPHFITHVDATDDVAVEHVELIVDGNMVASTTEAPYELVAPDLPEGMHTLEAKAFDVQGTPATSEPVAIDLGPPCTAAAGCEGTDVCVMGLCVAGPDAPGGLGVFCQADTECLSHHCVTDGASGEAYCVEGCDLSAGSCPNDFECVATGASNGVCWPNASGGCCDAGGHGGPGAMLLGLGVMTLVFRRRRGSSASLPRTAPR